MTAPPRFTEADLDLHSAVVVGVTTVLLGTTALVWPDAFYATCAAVLAVCALKARRAARAGRLAR